MAPCMCNKLKMIALLEKRLELDRRNHGKNGHHFDISAIFFSCTLSDSRTTLTASLALAFTVELSLLSVEEQENRGHEWYMQWQSPACTASILLSYRERRTHVSYMRWHLHPQISVEEQTEREPIAWSYMTATFMHCKFFLELERRQLKEATGHTCSDQHVHSPLTFAFTEEQSNRAQGSYMQCHSNLWTATCLHCK